MTDKAENAKVPLAALAAWLAGPACAAAALGFWPTWRQAGAPGLAAMGAAAVAAFAGMFLSNVLVFWRKGLRLEQAALRLAGATIIRLSICLAIAVGAWYVFRLPPAALFLWTGAFYLVMLVGDSIWLVRTLRRTAAPGRP